MGTCARDLSCHYLSTHDSLKSNTAYKNSKIYSQMKKLSSSLWAASSHFSHGIVIRKRFPTKILNLYVSISLASNLVVAEFSKYP